MVEIYVAIIGACLPTLAPIYRLLRYGDPLSSKVTGFSKPTLPAKGSSARRLHGEDSFTKLSNMEHNFVGDYGENRHIDISSSLDGDLSMSDRGESYPMDGVLVIQKTVWSDNKHNVSVA